MKAKHILLLTGTADHNVPLNKRKAHIYFSVIRPHPQNMSGLGTF